MSIRDTIGHHTHLNSRLNELQDRFYSLTQQIGGHFPVGQPVPASTNTIRSEPDTAERSPLLTELRNGNQRQEELCDRLLQIVEQLEQIIGNDAKTATVASRL